MGKQFRSSGPTAKFFFIWISLRRSLKEKVIIHENVIQFGSDELALYLGDLYFIHRLVVSANELGWASTRVRQFHVLILKTWILPVLCPPGCRFDDVDERVLFEQIFPYHDWLSLFSRRAAYDLHAYVCATDSEVAAELKDARGRKFVRDRHQQGGEFSDDRMGSHLHALTRAERRRLDEYQKACPGTSCDLMQNMIHRSTKSTRSGALPTLCRGMGRIWVPSIERWLHTVELFESMGFPITEASVAATGVKCVFTRGAVTATLRKRGSICNEIGNSFHINMVGAVSLLNLLLLPFEHFGSVSSNSSATSQAGHVFSNSLRAFKTQRTELSGVPAKRRRL